MGAATAVKDVLGALKGTTLGKKLSAEVAAAESAREARVSARAKLDEALVEREQIPALAEAVAKAEARYRAEMDRLAGKLYDAQRAHNDVAASSSRKHARGEGWLRRTAHPLCHDDGPVVWALRDAIQHLRRHLIGVGDEDRIRRHATMEPLTPAREDREPIDRARALVKSHDAALELIDAFRFAIDELRDLQLEVDADADPAAVRQILEGLPTRCIDGCHIEPFPFEAALAAAAEPKEIK